MNNEEIITELNNSKDKIVFKDDLVKGLNNVMEKSKDKDSKEKAASMIQSIKAVTYDIPKLKMDAEAPPPPEPPKPEDPPKPEEPEDEDDGDLYKIWTTRAEVITKLTRVFKEYSELFEKINNNSSNSLNEGEIGSLLKLRNEVSDLGEEANELTFKSLEHEDLVKVKPDDSAQITKSLNVYTQLGVHIILKEQEYREKFNYKVGLNFDKKIKDIIDELNEIRNTFKNQFKDVPQRIYTELKNKVKNNIIKDNLQKLSKELSEFDVTNIIEMIYEDTNSHPEDLKSLIKDLQSANDSSGQIFHKHYRPSFEEIVRECQKKNPLSEKDFVQLLGFRKQMNEAGSNVNALINEIIKHKQINDLKGSLLEDFEKEMLRSVQISKDIIPFEDKSRIDFNNEKYTTDNSSIIQVITNLNDKKTEIGIIFKNVLMNQIFLMKESTNKSVARDTEKLEKEIKDLNINFLDLVYIKNGSNDKLTIQIIEPSKTGNNTYKEGESIDVTIKVNGLENIQFKSYSDYAYVITITDSSGNDYTSVNEDLKDQSITKIKDIKLKGKSIPTGAYKIKAYIRKKPLPFQLGEHDEVAIIVEPIITKPQIIIANAMTTFKETEPVKIIFDVKNLSSPTNFEYMYVLDETSTGISRNIDQTAHKQSQSSLVPIINKKLEAGIYKLHIALVDRNTGPKVSTAMAEKEFIFTVEKGPRRILIISPTSAQRYIRGNKIYVDFILEGFPKPENYSAKVELYHSDGNNLVKTTTEKSFYSDKLDKLKERNKFGLQINSSRLLGDYVVILEIQNKTNPQEKPYYINSPFKIIPNPLDDRYLRITKLSLVKISRNDKPGLEIEFETNLDTPFEYSVKLDNLGLEVNSGVSTEKTVKLRITESLFNRKYPQNIGKFDLQPNTNVVIVVTAYSIDPKNHNMKGLGANDTQSIDIK